MRKKPSRIDLCILGYLETVASLRLPVLIVFAALFGFQLAINTAPASGIDWLAPAGAGAILLWLVVAWTLARWHWPQGAQLVDLLRAFRIAGIGTAVVDGRRHKFMRSRTGLVLLTLIALLAVPHWLGLLAAVITAYLLILFPVMEELPSGDVMVSLAAMALAMPIGSALGPLGLGLVPPLSAGAMLAAVSALTLAAITAKQAHYTEREPLFWPERWSMGWALVAVPLVFMPQAWVPGAVFLLACMAIPTLAVFVLLLRLRRFSKLTRDSLQYSDLRAHLAASRPSNMAPESVLRESDGYFRLCIPAYAAINPGKSEPSEGPNGVVAWIGGGNDEALPEAIGECIAIRNLGDPSSERHVYADWALQCSRRALVEALPDFKLPRLADFQEDLRNPWDVRLLPSNSPTLLTKLPWEHPELLLVPVHWRGTLTYPPGGGIHDSGGIPCFFDEVEIGIDIDVNLLDELRQATGLSRKCRETLRLLQWNYRRILPAAYECLYGALIAELRNYRLPLFFELEKKAPPTDGATDAPSEGLERPERRVDEEESHVLGDANLTGLLQRVNDRLSVTLPEPIQRLVGVRVLMLSQPDTAILAASQRAAVKDFRSEDSTLDRRKLEQLQALEEELKDELYLRGEMRHALTLKVLRPDILATVEECQSDIIEHVNLAGPNLLGNVTGPALEAIENGTNVLREAIIAEMDRLAEAPNVIFAAFNDDPGEPDSGKASSARSSTDDRDRSAP
jgi:hypothetical protein